MTRLLAKAGESKSAQTQKSQERRELPCSRRSCFLLLFFLIIAVAAASLPSSAIILSVKLALKFSHRDLLQTSTLSLRPTIQMLSPLFIPA